MTYTLQCVGTDTGWRWRVTLRVKQTCYPGSRTYATYRSAERAAKATGAKHAKGEAK